MHSLRAIGITAVGKASTIADLIGVSDNPPPHPLDILAVDTETAVRLGYAMACRYRDLALAAFAKISEQHKIIERQRETIGHLREEFRALQQARRTA